MVAASFHSPEDASEFLPHGIGKEMIIVEDSKKSREQKASCLLVSWDENREGAKLKTVDRSSCKYEEKDIRDSQDRKTFKKSKPRPHTSRIENSIRPKKSPLIPSSCTRSHVKNNAGERLYARALEQAKKLEMKRLEKVSEVNQKIKSKPNTMTDRRLGTSKFENQYCMNRVHGTPGRKTLKIKPKETVDKRKSNPLGNKTRTNRLYNTSIKKQEEGKKLREEIAKKSKARNSIPNSKDFGTISVSKAQEMYEKGIIARREKESKIAQEQEKRQRLLEREVRDYGKISKSQVGNMYCKGLQSLILKELKIAEKQQKILEGEIAMHEFKLAHGAFALQRKSQGKQHNCAAETDTSSATTCSIRTLESDDGYSRVGQTSWNNRKEGLSSAKLSAFRQKYV